MNNWDLYLYIKANRNIFKEYFEEKYNAKLSKIYKPETSDDFTEFLLKENNTYYCIYVTLKYHIEGISWELHKWEQSELNNVEFFSARL